MYVLAVSPKPLACLKEGGRSTEADRNGDEHTPFITIHSHACVSRARLSMSQHIRCRCGFVNAHGNLHRMHALRLYAPSFMNSSQGYVLAFHGWAEAYAQAARVHIDDVAVMDAALWQREVSLHRVLAHTGLSGYKA